MKIFKKAGKALSLGLSIVGVSPGVQMAVAGAKALETLSKDETETVKIAENTKTDALLDLLEAGATVLAARTDNEADDSLVCIAKAIRREYEKAKE